MSAKNSDNKVSRKGKEKARRKRRHSDGDDGLQESGVEVHDVSDEDELNVGGRDIKKVKKPIKDITDCYECLDAYVEPKILPCMHTFCMKCLQGIASKLNKSPGDVMLCPRPLCRTEFTIPEEGLEGLKKNSLMEKFLDMKKTVSFSTTSPPVCEFCKEDINDDATTKIPTAELFCLDCRHKLCQDCGKHHRKYKTTKAHKVVALNGPVIAEIGRIVRNMGPSFCNQHEDESLTMCCLDCKEVVCALCFIESHKLHNGTEVNKVVDIYRKQIQKNIDESEEFATELLEMLASLRSAVSAYPSKVNAAKADVYGTRMDLEEMAGLHAESLFEELDVMSEERMKEAEFARDNMDMHLASLSSYKEFCIMMVNRGSASDICQAVNDLNKRSSDFQEFRASVEGYLKPLEFFFRKAPLEEFIKKHNNNIIGKISSGSCAEKESTLADDDDKDEITKLLADNDKLKEETKQLKSQLAKKRKCVNGAQKTKCVNASAVQPQIQATKITYKTHPLAAKVLAMTAMRMTNKNLTVKGLAMIDDELFVLSSGRSPDIEVYDLKNYILKYRIQLQDVVSAGDMTSCKAKKCLYVSDVYRSVKTNPNRVVRKSVSSQIHRLQPNGTLIKKWSTGVIAVGGPASKADEKLFDRSLSVANDTNVILTNSYEKKLREYTPDGQLIRETDLSGLNISHPWQAIKLASGHFLVSHGDTGDALNRVCLLDGNNRLVRSFGGSGGTDYDQLCKPMRMAIDSDGSVLVIEGSDRVSLLRPDLHCKKKLLSKKDKLITPKRILLDESGGRLFVAHVDRLSNALNHTQLNNSVPALGRPLNVPALGRSLNVPALGRPLNVPALGRSLNVPALGRSLNVPALGRPLNMPALGRPLNDFVISVFNL